MRLFSKYLLLLTSAPVVLWATVLAFSTTLMFVAGILFGLMLPVMGLFSGFVGASDIFSEYAKIFILSLLAVGFSFIAIFFVFKFITNIWKDLHTKSHVLIFFLGSAILASIITSIVSEPVINYLDQINSKVSASVEESQDMWPILLFMIPYSFLILFYVRLRDGHLSFNLKDSST